MAYTAKPVSTYCTQTQYSPATNAKHVNDILGSAIGFNQKSDLQRQPPELRYRHLSYTLHARDPQVCSVESVNHISIGTRDELHNSFKGTSPDLSMVRSVPFIGVDIDIPTSWANLAELDMYRNMQDQKVELLTILAELRKTAEGVIQPLSQLYNAVRDARRGRWRAVLRHLRISRHSWRANARNIGGRWLEISFGWLPLLSDIGSLMDLANGLITRPLEFTARGKYLRPVNTTTSRDDVVQRQKGYRGVRCSCIVRCRSELLQYANSLSLPSPQSTAWELSPFSFLLDYVVPIGDWLNALSAPMGFHFVTGSITRFQRVMVNESYSHSSTGYQSFLVETGTCSYGETYMNRAVWTDFPVPSLGLKNPLSSLKRGANIASLLAQLLR